jgi:hypothetical protein
MDCVFIDFKSAFNTVSRERIYDLLRTKQILPQDEINFIQRLHSLIHFKEKGQTYWFRNGLPQGSTLSPALFDIYMENLIENLREGPDLEFISLLFADDVVFLLPHRLLEQFLLRLERICEKFSLIINKSKCGIIMLTEQNVK